MKAILPATVATLSLLFGVSASADPLTAQDYFEIEQLYSTYNEAIDTNKPEAWADTFTPDGTFNRSTGREALIGFVKQWHEKMGGTTRRHWNTNLKITGDSKQATGSVYLMLLDVGAKPPAIVATAMYADTLVKTPNGWRFSKRATRADAAPPAAGAPPAPAAPPAAR
jgi:hypothetical protein